MSIADLRRKHQAQQLGKHEFIAAASREHQSLFDFRSALVGNAIGQVSIDDALVSYTLRDPEISFVFDACDSRIAPIEALNFGDYEPDVRNTLCWLTEALAEAPGYIFDIGANIGWYSLILAKKYPEQTIVSFEPVEPIWRIFERNRLRNGLGNVRTFNIGLGDKEGKLQFAYDPQCSVASVLSTGTPVAQQQLVEAHVRRLDEFCETQGLWPKLIKSDIEGAELLMLKGAMQVLSQQRPVIVSEMLRKWAARFNYHPNDMIALLGDLGYACFAITKPGLVRFTRMEESTEATNFVFLHKQKHCALIETFAP